MFVYSVRASTLKFFAFLFLSVGLLIGIVVYGGSQSALVSADGEIVFSGIKTNEDRIAFLSGFGISVDPTPGEEKSFTLPKSFDRITSSYNEIQKSQGLDLSKYKGKRITRYTYKVTNLADGEREAYASVFVYKSRIVACDMSLVGEGGGVYALVGIDEKMFKR